MEKRAIITGITGQDGAYLAELLLKKGYSVFGCYRRTSSTNFWRIKELGIENHEKLILVEYDLTDMGNAFSLITKFRPHEIYNLAAQSFVGVSFEQPTATAQITALGTLNLLEAIRYIDKKIKFYQASTSELYGLVQEVPQTEKTPFYPRSPYAVAKLYAHWISINYREAYNIFAACGILFNHESPLRGIEFVTRKITDGVAKIALGKIDYIELGNIDAKRDWGYAKEYVEGMWSMLQSEKPDTYVLATGRIATVREFITLAFKSIGVEIVWEGCGASEVGIDNKSKIVRVRINPKFYRPAEVDLLIGDASKAARDLGWIAKTDLTNLCDMMVRADILRNENNISF